MINWIFVVLVCVLLVGILMMASTTVPSGVVWVLLLLLAIVLGRGSVRRWTARRRKEHRRDK